LLIFQIYCTLKRFSVIFFGFKPKNARIEEKLSVFNRFFNYEYDQNPNEYDQNLNEWKKDTDECPFCYNLLLNMLIFVNHGVDLFKKSKNINFMAMNAENYNMNNFLRNCYFY